MPLTITATTGESVTLTSAGILDPRLQQGPSRYTGLQTDSQVTFYSEHYLRARLEGLAELAGRNVTQTVNRAGKIQLTSAKPCAFVRFTWGRRTPGAQNYTPGERQASAEGVFVLNAGIEGLTESLTLTLFRGDWLYQAGQVVRFG